MVDLKQKFGKHLKYASYVFRHKWFVFQEARKLGVTRQGITHDLSKFLPDEWFPYVETFYGDGRKPKEAVKAAFNMAWLRHIHRNPHHWQHFLLQEDEGDALTLDMPEAYIREMVADWKGAGKAQGHGDDVRDWFDKNHHKHRMSHRTRWILYGLLERYDLLLKILVEATKDSIPPGVVRIGANRGHLMLVVQNLNESVGRCERWFDSIQKCGIVTEDYYMTVYEEDEPKPGMQYFIDINDYLFS